MKTTRRAFIKGIIAFGGALAVPDRILQAAQKNDDHHSPAYALLESKGQLIDKVERAYAIFEECRLCPRQCGANRLIGEKGFCRAMARAVFYSAHPHFG